MDLGLITMDQLVQAMAEQLAGGGRERIGEILVRRGHLTAEQVASLLAHQKQDLARIELTRRRRAATPPPANAVTEVVERGLGGNAGAWLDGLVDRAAEWHASDLHLASGAPLTFRVDHQLHAPNPVALTRVHVEAVMGALGVPADGSPAVRALGQAGDRRVRVVVERSADGGLAVCLRLLAPAPQPLAALRLPGALARFASLPAGLVLLAGGPRSGRTTTWSAILGLVHAERRLRVLALSPVVEVPLPPGRSVVTHRALGSDDLDALAALTDADVVALDPLPPRAAPAALALAESGRLVIATLTAPTPARATERFREQAAPGLPDPSGAAGAAIERALAGAVSQRLVPSADGQGLIPDIQGAGAGGDFGGELEISTWEAR